MYAIRLHDHDGLGVVYPKAGRALMRKFLNILSRSFVWPFMAKDVHAHVHSCSVCQKCDKQGLAVSPWYTYEPFESVGIDIVGPFPTGRGGNRYVLTCICLATRYPSVCQCIMLGLLLWLKHVQKCFAIPTFHIRS